MLVKQVAINPQVHIARAQRHCPPIIVRGEGRFLEHFIGLIEADECSIILVIEINGMSVRFYSGVGVLQFEIFVS